MGKPRRIFREDGLYLVTNRTILDLPLMAPSKEVNAIIRNNLAWAAARYSVELHAFCFESDFFGMLIRAPHLNLSQFMGDFQGVTAREINAVLGRSGQFFAGRFEDSEILDDAAMRRELGKLLSAPCVAERGDDTDEKVGVSSWQLHRTGEALVGEREDRVRFREIKRENPRISDEKASEIATTKYTVELARLQMWGAEPHMEYHRAVCAEVERYVDRSGVAIAEVDMASSDEKELGDETLRHSRRPLFLTTRASLLRVREEERAQKNLRYDIAAARLRRNRGSPRFPHGMIPPHQSGAVGATRPSPGDTLNSPDGKQTRAA